MERIAIMSVTTEMIYQLKSIVCLISKYGVTHLLQTIQDRQDRSVESLTERNIKARKQLLNKQ